MIQRENCATTESLSESTKNFFAGEDVSGLTPFSFGCSRTGETVKNLCHPPRLVAQLRMAGYGAQYCVFPTRYFFLLISGSILGPSNSHGNQGTTQLAV